MDELLEVYCRKSRKKGFPLTPPHVSCYFIAIIFSETARKLFYSSIINIERLGMFNDYIKYLCS